MAHTDNAGSQSESHRDSAFVDKCNHISAN